MAPFQGVWDLGDVQEGCIAYAGGVPESHSAAGEDSVLLAIVRRDDPLVLDDPMYGFFDQGPARISFEVQRGGSAQLRGVAAHEEGVKVYAHHHIAGLWLYLLQLVDERARAIDDVAVLLEVLV